MRYLYVRAPMMKGDDVRRVQRALRDKGFKPGPVDGEFGPRTGTACAVAKRKLGYRKADCQPTAGAALLGYLTGTKKRTPAMVARAKARAAVDRETARRRGLRLGALVAAKADIPLYEGPNNDIKYNRWWGDGHNDGGAYCVRTVSYWYAKAKSLVISPSAGRFQNTDYLLDCAKAGKYGLRLVSEPAPGDAFVIDWEGHTDPDHAGIVEHAHESTVDTIEGNATLPNGRQGVGRHNRPRRQCWFIRFTK